MRLDAKTLRGDIFGGLTAAVVALPLAMAFGVASGVGPIAGLYGAIAVGFFAAVFGGTPAQVSGPTGPMTVVMAVVVADHADNLPQAFAIVFLGGAIQMAFGFLKVGRYVSYTPYSVVSGFMSGIGVIIILIQTLPFVGLATASGGPVGAIAQWASLPARINLDALIIACLSLGVMTFWPNRLRAVLPSPLAALIVGTLCGVFIFSGAPIIADVPTGLPDLHVPVFSLANLPSIVQPALILALLGSIDSLLTSLVADSITRTRHNSDRELIGQGIGNMVAGLIGGLPGAGATMRTVVNVRAGGRTPLSGALHAIVLLALALGLGPLAENIPHAVLAGILMKVGWDIIDWDYLKRCRRAPREKVLVMFVTLGLTVFVDLITAVAVGLILAGFVTAKWMEREELKGVTSVALPEDEHGLSETERDALRKHNGQIAVVFLRGRFSYASARELIQRAHAVSAGYKTIIYDMTNAAHVDTSAALAIEGFLTTVSDDGAECYIAGLSGDAADTLNALGVLERIPATHVTPTLLDAINTAGERLAPA
ncbi:MAG: SulP family inorganic anion transporter [Rhodospirillaceae bacterium]|nr:SulP family inorganic anion transporter [Rhodospirillaceae bacterium]MBT5666987.1 SulP family inorganic anion transporter [Rhodospirillaceae bacterium]MBT5809787.1 SulP family inorganic anion transporter [Rhodospirillaceae bacterium]